MLFSVSSGPSLVFFLFLACAVSLFRVGLAGGQQSGAKQQRPGSPYNGCVETDENARFGSILYPIGK